MESVPEGIIPKNDNAPERDLKMEVLNSTRAELEAYRLNKDKFDTEDNVPGHMAGTYLHGVSKEGATYEQIGSTPEEIEAEFGEEMRAKFDENSK